MPLDVFVTGATGNLGGHTVDALLEHGHRVRALVFDGAAPKRWATRVEVVRGDLRDEAVLKTAVRGRHAVIHLAFIIPPECLARPEHARAVNVGGTQALISAMKAEAPQAKLLFASTLDVYGHTGHLPPPRRVSDPVQATDAYSEHKLTCERLVRESGLSWGILRYADIPPLALRGPVPIMFELPLEQRIECVHPLDAAQATARAAASDETWGRVWNIGGGARCQLTYRQYLGRMLEAMELGGELPASAFTTRPWPTDWLDSADSERAFQYQRRTFDDVVRDVSALLGWRRPFARLARPLVRRWMLRLSPYYRR